MLKNLNKPYPFFDDLVYNLKVFLGISMFLFLFILFFQPVELRNFEFNNQLLIIAGFGGITFLILSINFILFPSIFPKIFLYGNWQLHKDILLNFITWAFLAVAFNFYSHYVGLISITFHLSFRIILLALLPVVALIILHQFKIYKINFQQILDLTKNAGIPFNIAAQDNKIEFITDNKAENFNIHISNLVMIKSANNYIEIFRNDNGVINKKLIRSTLKNAENQLKSFPNVIRCHRTTLVNIDYIMKLSSGQQGSILHLKNMDEKVPVSRQFIVQVKEAIKSR